MVTSSLCAIQASVRPWRTQSLIWFSCERSEGCLRAFVDSPSGARLVAAVSRTLLAGAGLYALAGRGYLTRYGATTEFLRTQ